MQAKNSVGEKIRDLRKKLKLTQAELAGTDFTKSFISQVEKGLTNPSLKSLSIIAQRLGIPVSYLLGEEEVGSASRKYIEILEQARLATSQRNFSKAIEKYIEAIDACDDSDHAGIGFTYLLLAEARAELGTNNRVIHDLELAVEHLQLSHDHYNLARAYNYLGHYFAVTNQHQMALNSFAKGVEIFEDGRARDHHLELRIRTNLGITLSRLGRHHESIESLEEVLKMMKTQDSFIEFGKVCHTLGYSHAALGNIEKALSYTRQAANLYLGLEHWEFASECQINLGLFMHKFGDLEGARTAFETLTRGQLSSSEVQIARAHFGLAEVERDEGNIDAAYDHLMRAFTLAPTYAGASDWTSTVVACAEIKPVPAELVEMIERLAAKWKGEPRGLADIHSNLGKIYSRMGNTEKANEHLSKSVDLYRKT